MGMGKNIKKELGFFYEKELGFFYEKELGFFYEKVQNLHPRITSNNLE
jgi:hypothetical protein